MRIIKNIFAIFSLSLFISCNSEPSLQKYFAENTENKDFIAIDISSDILNIDKAKLSETQKKALSSFDKVNILAFKKDEINKTRFETEKTKIITILKNPKYQQLIKIGNNKQGASINYLGTDDNIKEFVIYIHENDNGFAIIRILGENMNSENIMTILSVLKESNVNIEQLKPLQQLVQ